jgi:hypothetical protein
MNTRKRIDTAAEKVFQNTRDKGKRNRTLSLDDGNFKRLQAFCHEHSLSVSGLLDDLIAAFLEADEVTEVKTRTKPKGER